MSVNEIISVVFECFYIPAIVIFYSLLIWAGVRIARFFE